MIWLISWVKTGGGDEKRRRIYKQLFEILNDSRMTTGKRVMYELLSKKNSNIEEEEEEEEQSFSSELKVNI